MSVELYSPDDVAILSASYNKQQTQNFHDRVHQIQAELDPHDINPAFWGIEKEAWGKLTPDAQRAVAATKIVKDIEIMKRAGIDPDTWYEMPLEDRKTHLNSHD